jgi:hypothetical protein
MEKKREYTNCSVVVIAMPDWMAVFHIAIMQRPLLLNHKTVKKWDFYVEMAGRFLLLIFKVTVEYVPLLVSWQVRHHGTCTTARFKGLLIIDDVNKL